MQTIQEVARNRRRFTRKREGSSCWWWALSTTKQGYGQVSAEGVRWLAHRAFWTALVGPIPVKRQIDHLCRHPSCVNPAHMELVTLKENVLRGRGITARNARRTRCRRGHLFTDQNTYRLRGHRTCRRCQAAAQRRYKKRHPERVKQAMRKWRAKA